MHIIFLFKVLEGVPVTDIITENSTFDRKRVVSVETPYGSIKTKHVVNCTGVWANYCAAMVIITTYMLHTYYIFCSLAVRRKEAAIPSGDNLGRGCRCLRRARCCYEWPWPGLRELL